MTLLEIAKTYVGTPHLNGGDIKGVGLDCCTLPAHILSEWRGVNFLVDFGYSADWYCRRNTEELLLPYLEKYCNPVKELREGDVISYAYGRARYAHLSVYLGADRVIHCSADEGTKIVDVNASCFYFPSGKSRISGYWRLKDGLFI